jgi:hypothetical protein
MAFPNQTLVPADASSDDDEVVPRLILRSARNAALMQGDIGRYNEFVPIADDFLPADVAIRGLADSG